jgi:Ser/Thr protein kinase RdoA (MazF antagonist)
VTAGRPSQLQAAEDCAPAANVVRRFLPEHTIARCTEIVGSGLSGARVIRVDAMRAGRPEQFCLKGTRGPDAAALRFPKLGSMLENLAAETRLLPQPIRAATGFVAGEPWSVTAAGRQWRMCTWTPGECLGSGALSFQVVQACATGLAEWHEASARAATQNPGKSDRIGRGRSPAALDRCARLERLLQTTDFGIPCPPGEGMSAEMRAVAAELGEAVCDAGPRQARRAVAAFAAAPAVTQRFYCWGDARRENAVVQADRLRGFIDFSAICTDSPALDIAALVGSLAEGDEHLATAAVTAYGRRRAVSTAERELAFGFAAAWPVLTACNWITWLADGTARRLPPDIVLGRLPTGQLQSPGWHAMSAAKGVETNVAAPTTPFPPVRACHPNDLRFLRVEA